MTLRPCAECGASISDAAAVCPQCGASAAAAKPGFFDDGCGCILVVAVVLVMGFLVSLAL